MRARRGYTCQLCDTPVYAYRVCREHLKMLTEGTKVLKVNTQAPMLFGNEARSLLLAVMEQDRKER